MINKELELIGQLIEVAMTVAELKAENKKLKDINKKLNQTLCKTDVVGQSEQLVCPECLSNRILEYKDKNQCRLCWYTWAK